MRPYAFGVDIGGTAIKLGLFQTTGELLEKATISTKTTNHKVKGLVVFAIFSDIKWGRICDRNAAVKRDDFTAAFFILHEYISAIRN